MSGYPQKKNTVIALIFILGIGTAAAENRPTTGLSGGLSSLTGGVSQLNSVVYSGRFIPGEKSGNTPEVNESNLNMSLPVYKTETETGAVILGGGNYHMSHPVQLETERTIPNELHRTEAGVQYSRKLPDQRSMGIRASFGATGDKIENRTESFHVSATYSFPSSNESQWVLMLIMSNNSSLGIFVPYPGFLYIYKTPTFTGLFGLPLLSLQWTPEPPWAFSFSVMGPQVKTEVAYGSPKETQFFTDVAWIQQRYLLSDRTQERERLTIEEKIAEVGLRKPLLPGLFTEFQAGYSFDRSMYVGETIFKRNSDSAALESNAYIKWTLRMVF